ncbi:glycoside hydrolase family 108 protein [Cupriavidus sp. UYPR2.512]|uniref:glycoside hydrolase family 108 protein n=1 Tax=Cupriavidus sp. UYPR2.512 TaxID=1080187 RepID=UPI000363A302|nr:glycosyl hydrolase 108 family protein [Cupriavidus sp. UYPR2.512]UIF90871.1 glycoside hydrolase family 108 protein [Cupriavidus necator]
MDFNTAFDRLLGSEGGYSNRNPKDDPGGETNWGISKRSYPSLNIKALTREDARRIYERDFWSRTNADQLYPSVAFQTFDFAVNSGIETAVRKLQVALGVADDGHWGPITAAAAKRMSETDQLFRLNAERLDFMRRLSNWGANASGWAGRIAQNLRYCAVDA